MGGLQESANASCVTCVAVGSIDGVDRAGDPEVALAICTYVKTIMCTSQAEKASLSILGIIELVKFIFTVDQLLQFWGQLATSECLRGIGIEFVGGAIVVRILVPTIPEHDDTPHFFVWFLETFGRPGFGKRRVVVGKLMKVGKPQSRRCSDVYSRLPRNSQVGYFTQKYLEVPQLPYALQLTAKYQHHTSRVTRSVPVTKSLTSPSGRSVIDSTVTRLSSILIGLSAILVPVG